jgi:hypothetical protein
MKGSFGLDLLNCYLLNLSTFNRRNGQAYVTFTQRDTVEKTLAVQKHSIDGCNVHCQRVFTLLELRARVPNNENRENWSKGKNYRDQPRCALTDDRPENISKSTEHVVNKKMNPRRLF